MSKGRAELGLVEVHNYKTLGEAVIKHFSGIIDNIST